MNNGNLTVQSPAKINLFLKIISKESDYHMLESVLAYIDLYDILTINYQPKKRTLANIEASFLGKYREFIDLNNNILTEIFNYFNKNYHLNYDIKIKIDKKIPVGAGLGGGSSNGAFFMMALNKINNIGLTKQEMQEISFEFGSDLAFFFEESSCIVRNRGHIYSKYSGIEELSFLLINPNIFISTKEIFSKFNGNFLSEIDDKEINSYKILDLIEKQPNQLEEIVLNKYKKIAELKNFIINLKPLSVKMTGSGSSFIAFFTNDKIHSNLEILKKEFPEYLILKQKIISKWQPNF